MSTEAEDLRRTIRSLVAQIDRLEDELRDAKAESARATAAMRARAVAVIDRVADSYARKGHLNARFPPNGEDGERAKLLRELARIVSAL